MPPGSLLVVAFGLALGSFLNVCIYRIPRGLSVILPRSHCPQCDHKIRPWENIPLLSYLFLGGRCGSCGRPIGWVYPAVEALTALLMYLLFLKYGFSFSLMVNAIAFSLLVVLIFIDLFERLLPNPLTLGGMVLGFLLAPLQSSEFFIASTPSLWEPYWQSFLGALIGGGVLWAVAKAYFKVRKVEGMGFGDIKMMAMVGAFLGWRFAWLTIFLGSLMGAVVGAFFIYSSGKDRRYELPFGSFLGVGAVIATLWGRDLLSWYFG
ncbi:MAG: prepilin peptidase [Acidobacteriota bacterium]